TVVVRLAAVRALGLFKKDPAATETVIELVRQPDLGPDLRLEGVAALGRLHTGKAVSFLQQVAADAKGYDLVLRPAAVAGLTPPARGGTWLVEAYGKKQLGADLGPALSRLLRGSPFKEVRKQAEAAFPPPPPLDPKSLPSIAALLARKGSVE